MAFDVVVEKFLKNAIHTVSVNALLITPEIQETGALGDHTDSYVVASIGLSGPMGASLTLVTTERFACKIVSGMLSCEIPVVSQDVVDCVGELVIMLAGYFKTQMVSEGYPFALSIPAVIVGVDSAKIPSFKSSKSIYRFTKCKDFSFGIYFSYIHETNPQAAEGEETVGEGIPESRAQEATESLKNILKENKNHNKTVS